jgi:hypothetical protein
LGRVESRPLQVLMGWDNTWDIMIFKTLEVSGWKV